MEFDTVDIDQELILDETVGPEKPIGGVLDPSLWDVDNAGNAHTHKAFL